MNNLQSKPKNNIPLIVLQILVALLYGTGFCYWVVLPVGRYLFISSPEFPFPLNSGLSLVVSLICLMAWAGHAVMYRSLHSVSDKTIVKGWAAVALLMALFSAYFYMWLVNYFLFTSNVRFLNGLKGAILMLGSAVFGFYLPFALLIFWIKYRYRQDEY